MASVLKDVTKVLPNFSCRLSILLSHYLFGGLDSRIVKEIFPDEKQRVFPLAIIQYFSKSQLCYNSSKKHWVSSGIRDTILLLLDIFPSFDECERSEKWQKPVSDLFGDCEAVFQRAAFLRITNWTANNEQSTFVRTEPVLKVLPLISKAASCFYGQIVSYWRKGNIPRFDKFCHDTNNKDFTWITCGRS